jgi:hypothetical protein
MHKIVLFSFDMFNFSRRKIFQLHVNARPVGMQFKIMFVRLTRVTWQRVGLVVLLSRVDQHWINVLCFYIRKAYIAYGHLRAKRNVNVKPEGLILTG